MRYEELVAESENVVRELVKMFNIEMTEDNMPRVLDTMKEHSQEGVFTAHEHEGYDSYLLLYYLFVLIILFPFIFLIFLLPFRSLPLNNSFTGLMTCW